MKALVTYASQTNNTRKLAEAVADSLAVACDLKPMAEIDGVAEYDFIAVGFWFKGGQPDPVSQEFLGKLAGKKVFLFASHGAAPGSQHVISGMTKAGQLAVGTDIIGQFSCQGEVDPRFLEMAAAKNPPPPWLADAPLATGHPDGRDIAQLQAMVAALSLP